MKAPGLFPLTFAIVRNRTVRGMASALVLALWLALFAAEMRACCQYRRAGAFLHAAREIRPGDPLDKWVQRLRPLGLQQDSAECYGARTYPGRFEATLYGFDLPMQYFWTLRPWINAAFGGIGLRLHGYRLEICGKSGKVSSFSYVASSVVQDGSWRMASVWLRADPPAADIAALDALRPGYRPFEFVMETDGGGRAVGAWLYPGASDQDRRRAFDIHLQCLVSREGCAALSRLAPGICEDLRREQAKFGRVSPYIDQGFERLTPP